MEMTQYFIMWYSMPEVLVSPGSGGGEVTSDIEMGYALFSSPFDEKAVAAAYKRLKREKEPEKVFAVFALPASKIRDFLSKGPEETESKQEMIYIHEYQSLSAETARYPNIEDQNNGLLYVVLGLSAETGEFLNKIKKVYRDDGGHITPERMDQLEDELGDVLWYLSQCCTELGLSLTHVARKNVAKLTARRAAGTIGGSGDKR